MSLNPHPFLQQTAALISLPPQLIPLAEKTTEWGERNLDALESIGRQQYYERFGMLENYRMRSGQFLEYQYRDVDDNEYQSLIQLAQETFQKQLHLRHFDFISEIVNTLCGELEGHPDIYKVKAEGETVDNARKREKSQMLQKYVQQQIDDEINQQLLAKGLDPNRTDFASSNEQQQYQQQVEEAKQQLTPESIQQYINTNWQSVAEIWANIVLTDARKRYELPRKEVLEFEDMLTVNRCFRHFYLTGTGFEQETWNPLDVFYSHHLDLLEVEKGDYVGRTFYLSLSQVIDQYGYLLTGDQLNELYGEVKFGADGINRKDAFGNTITYTNPDGLPYGSRIPWNNPYLNLLPQVSNTAMGVNQDIIFGRGISMQPGNLGQYQVTHAYWKSQKKVGKLTWINPQTQILEKIIVDETVVLPKGTRVITGNLYGEPDEEIFDGPTIEWTWINEIWGGLKITPLSKHQLAIGPSKPLYVNIKPIPFQGKPDAFLYEAELPVVGMLPSNRNAPSQSLVDIVKPYQILYNLFLNQAMVMAEEEILPFMMIDNNAIPKLKDWKGEDGFVKWFESIRSVHMGIVDTRPQAMNGANAGGQFPQVINLDVTNRILSRYELAKATRQMALQLVGTPDQRLGDIKPQETATGIQQAAERSYIQTAGYFNRFYHYKKRCLRKTLDFAQYVQAGNKDITVSAINSDYSQSLLTLNGTDLLTTQLHVYVTDSQQEQRNLEIARQLALQNTTTATTDERLTMATETSMEKIREVVHQSTVRQQQMQQQQQQLEQQKLEAAQKLQQDKQAFEAEQNQLDREERLQEAYIRTFAMSSNAIADTNKDSIPDAFEYDKFALQQQNSTHKMQSDQQKLDLKRLEILAKNQQHQQDISDRQQQRQSQEKIARMKQEDSRILGDKNK